MVGKVLELDKVIEKDQLGCYIANQYITWNNLRGSKEEAWKEVRQYVYQTDTTQTTNKDLPWKNTTTTPKLCQIRDNLYANYLATMFPKRRWLIWEGDRDSDEAKQKKEAIENYIAWAIDRKEFKDEISKLVLDYIDFGNCFAAVEWTNNTIELSNKKQVGYEGPSIRRISPLDLVMNPIAPSFDESPKILRTLMSLGEFKVLLNKNSKPDNAEELESLFRYLLGIREKIGSHSGSLNVKDAFFSVDGFDSFQAYLNSDYIEVLTFYGDAYDRDNDTLYENHEIMVVDRHKVVFTKPNPSYFAKPPIYHSGWRIRQDNLWAMGPLDNLVGLQYRIDHLENMKADLMDLTTFPPLKIKGFVDDFQWGPMSRIICGDDGDVELMSPDVNALAVNLEIQEIERKMEEMAGSPKEAMGIRTPGEKTAYEVQRLENAASRIFQSKIAQFEEQVIEPLLNAMLELARRKMTQSVIRVFNDEFKVASFQSLTPEDITGAGRIRPVAARHFAERAERIQNLNNFMQSGAYMDPAIQMHFSSIKLAQMFEELLELEDYEVVQENVRLLEQADAQRIMNTQQEDLLMEQGTPSGLTEEDVDLV